ncbi:adenylate kinase 5, chloroplastic-like [Euphorbia lathyris]|uniref:adenylate kinase 5, chloroplastic-like n=1 Tax=Euphorbia lathyris TaxID=212925 RepID=UPI003313739A
MELVLGIALSFSDDGKRVKVCVQGSIRQGALAGMPLQLSGTIKQPFYPTQNLKVIGDPKISFYYYLAPHTRMAMA